MPGRPPHVLLVAFALFLSGCAGTAQPNGARSTNDEPRPTMDSRDPTSPAQTPSNNPSPSPSASPSPSPTEPTPTIEPATPPQTAPPRTPTGFIPHVLVAVPDSGINPYHRLYYRPQLTTHPCTYIQDFPCDLQPLNLTVGGTLTWQQRLEADQAAWNSIKQGQWYWIPQTVFVAVSCDAPYVDNVDPTNLGKTQCILDDSSMHGTGTTSSVLMENPDALIAFKEGRSTIQPFLARKLPIDVYSISWANAGPIPAPRNPVLACPNGETAPIYVIAAGNDPRFIPLDCRPGNPRVISVTGGYAGRSTATGLWYASEALAGTGADLASYFCRPTAQTQSTDTKRTSYCGTSFSTPTVAGAISRVILAVRQYTGYTGSVAGASVDPLMPLSLTQLRDAVNRTASYAPKEEYSGTGVSSSLTGIPLDSSRPWLQWGWGWYDARVANATIDHLLGKSLAPAKPTDAANHMGTLYTLRRTLYG